MILDKVGTKTRVNRASAKKMFNEGQRIFVKPIFASPEDPRFRWAIADKRNDAFSSFDAFVSQYEYYNCNARNGRCASFYVEQL